MPIRNNERKPLTSFQLLAGRRYEELNAIERAVYGQLHNREATEEAQRICDNLNRNVMLREPRFSSFG